MKLIDKDALVAEIERRIKSTNNDVEIGAIESLTVSKTLNSLISFIETLEVKKVDLEKEIDNYLNPIEAWQIQEEPFSSMEKIAKHFFELGLNTQQNIDIDITNIDKVIEENGVDPNSKEAKMFKESYYMALEKFKAQKGE